jgi:hypothetical protein
MMFKAIKEFFFGKPVAATVVEVPYKVEAPVNPQITDAVTQGKPPAITAKKKPAPKSKAQSAKPAKPGKPAPAKKPPAPKKPAPAKKK